MASNIAENELNFLPLIYDGIKSAEKDSHDITQKLSDLKSYFQKARDCVEKLPGVQYSKEEQLRQIDILRDQLILKQELLQKYRNLSHFNLESVINSSCLH